MLIQQIQGIPNITIGFKHTNNQNYLKATVMNKKISNKMIPILSLVILSCFSGCEKGDSGEEDGTVTDIDGNVYKTVTIGTQVWMKENLKTTKYNDGSLIPLVTDNSEWIKLYLETDEDGFCWYDNDRSTYGDTYGAFYNWYAVEPDHICPAGWHLPSYDEWSTLIDFLGGSDEAGGEMKETGTTYWMTPNTGATNKSGFTALPAGGRPHVYGSFDPLGIEAAWWSKPKPGRTDPESLGISFNNIVVSRGTTFSTYGHSVRCIQD